MTLSRPALIFQKSLTVAHSKMNLADALNIAGFAYCTCDAGHNSKVGKIMVIKLHYVDVEGMVVHITLSCTTINTETGKGIAELIETVVDELFAVAGVERKVYIIGQCTDSASAVLKGLRAHMWNEPIYLVNNCAMHALSTIFSYPYLKAYADVCDISVMSPVSFLKNLSWLFQNWASEKTIKQILVAMNLPAAKLMQVTSSAIMLTRWFTVNNALVQICEDEAVWGMLMKFCEALADGATGTVKDVGTRIFKWMSSDVFKTQCYFLSAFCETFHTPYTAAVQASDEFVEKNETVRMIGGYRMRLMPRIYASMICEAEYLFETRETIGDDMKEGCPWARYRKLYNTLDDSLKRRINQQNEFFLKHVVVIVRKHTLETITSNIWCMCGDVFPFNILGAKLVNAAVAPLDERAGIITQIEKDFAEYMEVVSKQYGSLPRIRFAAKFLKVLTSRIGTSLAVPIGMSHALNARELDIIKKFAMQKLADVDPVVYPEVDHLDWSDEVVRVINGKAVGVINVDEHYLLGSKIKCFPSTSSTTEQAVKQGKSHSNNNNGSQQNISDSVLLSSCISLSLFNLATQQGMYDEYRNVEGADDDLHNATKQRKPKQEVKSLKTFLSALCYSALGGSEAQLNAMPEVLEARDRSRESSHKIEKMIADATTNEILEREEKLILKAEKHKTEPPLRAKPTIRCRESIKPGDKIAMAWSLAIEGKKAVTSLCSWAALTPELIARGINFRTISMVAAKQLLKEHEDCVGGFIELKGNYDIEDVQEGPVRLNEDNEALLDKEEIGDEEMGVALEDNEVNGDEQIVNE